MLHPLPDTRHWLVFALDGCEQPMEFDPGRWLPETLGHMAGGSRSSTEDNPGRSGSPDRPEAGQQPDPACSPPSPQQCACPFASMATRTGHAAAKQKSMLPFSDGPRNCIGLNFAHVSVRMVLLVGALAAVGYPGFLWCVCFKLANCVLV